MRWMLAGCWGLLFISLSVAQDKKLQIKQKPRYYGVTVGKKVLLYCLSSNQQFNSTVTWTKVDNYNDKKVPVVEGDNIKFESKHTIKKAFLEISRIQVQDSGIYYCSINTIEGPGTQVNVTRSISSKTAIYRSNVKDGLIIFQGLLLAVFIATLLLRKQKLLEQRDSEYEEPETDHIYEGLAIETCGGGLYEELSVYAQAEGAEAPWE
ncbi:B-cell antigen receptor complex-associated protein beta chain [Archocentrus centrarchus]|uniref:B-cell antigen receptor complex-associated protein beta chain n=1 Tax=Archocentrus centrarchus TaxID=63155 RepID=UPI0011EA38E5|nr:B-cell antigen receptor complex-associated protein beta chain [Archocentrus centrarchus]